ncbi:Fic family protein, partial [Ruminococcaceae bacterium OttesenSCG-928-I18]|nr:Fic family protein [Ruminococcaceae bacterium OttesenSCG-928-I18]
MEYIPLMSLYYKSKEEYENVYQRRIGNSDTVFMLPCNVKKQPAFVVNTGELTTLIQNIYVRNNKLTRLYIALPDVAIKSFLSKTIVDEIKSTNDIEGVYSTKKQLRLVLKNNKPKRSLRFFSLVQKYDRMLDNESNTDLNDSNDIRSLYDEMLATEVDKKDSLDGLIFRKDTVSIVDDLGRTIHHGVTPESTIIDMMDKSLKWINDKSIPHLVRVAAFHYLFGYIHPFYDGNGRMSRFISSLLLTGTLNILGALRLSTMIHKNKNMYYKAFKNANDKRNRGDVTPFVLDFLTILYNAVDDSVNNLTDGQEKLDHYIEILNARLNHLSKPQNSIMNIIIQNTLFDDTGITTSELSKASKYSETWTRETLLYLTENNYIHSEKDGRSYYHYANLDILDL